MAPSTMEYINVPVMVRSKNMSDRNNKIFLLVASYPDSIITFRGKLIEDIQNSGFEVHVAAPDIAGSVSIRDSLQKTNVHVHEIKLKRTSMNPICDVVSLFQLWKLMRTIKPSVTLCYTVKPVIYGSVAGWLAGVPRRFALITGLGYVFTGSGKSVTRKLVRIMYAFALARVEKVFFQNPDDEKLFKELSITKNAADTVVVHGSGVDVDEYKQIPLPNHTHFLLIARLLGCKGVREYAEACRIVKQKHPQVTCSLVGWIDDSPDSIGQHELDKWKSSGCVQFLGKLDDVREAIAEASVYVLPSYREGTPRTVLEAMAMGRPIITTNVPGCRETVLEGENGYLVKAKSVDELVSAMQLFIENPKLIEQMGERSRQIAIAKYDVCKVNSIMLEEMKIAE
jgi:glycosyltransferase involved in cell wall biosynthesis